MVRPPCSTGRGESGRPSGTVIAMGLPDTPSVASLAEEPVAHVVDPLPPAIRVVTEHYWSFLVRCLHTRSSSAFAAAKTSSPT